MKPPRFFQLVFFIVIAAISSIASAEHLPISPVPNNEFRRYEVKRLSQDPKASLFIRPEERVAAIETKSTWTLGKDASKYLIVERKEKKVGGQDRIWKFLFRTDNNIMILESYEQTEFSPGGKLLGKENCLIYIPGGRQIPPGTVHAFAMADALRGINFKDGLTTSCYNWNPQIEELLKVNIRVEGMEKVSVPAGSYNAWRVALDVDLEQILGRWRGLEYFIKKLMPKFTMWYADTPTKPMVKYQGIFGVGKATITEYFNLAEIR